MSNKIHHSTKKSIYIYPVTKGAFPVGGNNYILNLIKYLEDDFIVVNKEETGLGLIHMLFNLYRSNYIYFNWVEDIADKRFGYLQIPVLCLIVLLAKIFKIKLVWFVHDNLSHTKKNIGLKKFIAWMMARYSDFIIAHTVNTKYNGLKNYYAFDHPMNDFTPVSPQLPYKYDLLIWGKISPYKGITKFLEYAFKSNLGKKYKTLIAGKFPSQDYYNEVEHYFSGSITAINKIIPEAELPGLFAQSKYILFTYNSPSVLASAALCKTLAFGKQIIGPDIGSFKEFGEKGLIFTYSTFEDIEGLLDKLKNEGTQISQDKMKVYTDNTSWPKFIEFLFNVLNKRAVK